MVHTFFVSDLKLFRKVQPTVTYKAVQGYIIIYKKNVGNSGKTETKGGSFMQKQPLSHYIQSKKEATTLLNKVLNIDKDPANKEFVVFNVCESTCVDSTDAPCELETAFADSDSLEELCKNVSVQIGRASCRERVYWPV